MNLLTIATLKDGTISRVFKNYASSDAALTALYSDISSAVANANVLSFTAELITDSGRVEKCERYTRPTEIKKGGE